MNEARCSGRLDNVIANLELMPQRMNELKNSHVGQPEPDLPQRLFEAGLLSREGWGRWCPPSLVLSSLHDVAVQISPGGCVLGLFGLFALAAGVLALIAAWLVWKKQPDSFQLGYLLVAGPGCLLVASPS